jgi:hypothetical protein
MPMGMGTGQSLLRKQVWRRGGGGSLTCELGRTQEDMMTIFLVLLIAFLPNFGLKMGHTNASVASGPYLFRVPVGR